VQVIAAPLGDDLWEVDFPALKAAKGRVRYVDFPRTWAELDALAPDVLCIMEYPPPMLKALLWAKTRGVPVIVATEVGAGPPHQQDIGLRTRVLHGLMAHFTEGQLAFSPAAQVPFGALERPVCFAPHSIDTAEFTPRGWDTPSQTPVLLTVAQYHPRKGLDLMAAALAQVRMDFRWRVVGILDPAWLQSQVELYGLTERTVITGPIQGPALVSEFQSADGFVLPSRFDTYGVVTQEAAACGLPLLISRYAGSSQNLVEPGVNGAVIDPHDAAAFATELERLLGDAELRATQGLQSRRLAERWCVRQNAKRVALWLNQHFLS
jgi:glycosyltransferase involved in cell wall biosynthesis